MSRMCDKLIHNYKLISLLMHCTATTLKKIFHVFLSNLLKIIKVRRLPKFFKLPQKIVFLSIYYSILFCYHK